MGAADEPVTDLSARRAGGSPAGLRAAAMSPAAGRSGDAPARLSPREGEVLAALGERLTNAEIGGRLFLSVRTVETYVSALLRKFNAVNRRELTEIARQHQRQIGRRIGRPLPQQPTTLVGREGDIEVIIGRLQECRLLTVTGSAGVGKTRVALEVAARVEQAFGGGIVFVDLTPAADEATVLAACAGALGLTGETSPGSRDGLFQLLATGAPVLLVVDNCEHVLGSVSELLMDAIGMNDALTVLATSREALTVPGEHVFALTPLDESSAGQLFRARAIAVEPGLGVDDLGTMRAIGSICRRLDGLPLAIELAAVQVVAFTPQQIDARLTDRFALLRVPARGRSVRHAALETALGWSYDLLSAAERVLLDRLAVFRGRFGAGAVEAVATDVVIDSAAVLELLARLVRKSLVVAETVGDERRYRLLETVREYGCARLSAAHELERWRQRHLEWVFDLMAQAADRHDGGEQAQRFATLDEELPNIEAALEWSLRTPDHAAHALAAVQGVRSYWMAGGIRRGHGLRWLHATAAAASSLGAALRVRALLLGVLLHTLDDLRSARTLEDAASTMAGDDRMARAYAALASAVVRVHSGSDAESAARDAIATIPPDDQLHWWARAMLALDLARRGDPAEAAAELREVVDAFRSLGDEHHADGTLTYIADFTLGVGDVDTARTDAERALATARRFGCASCESQALLELALIDHPNAPHQRLTESRHALRLAHRIGETWNILAALDLIAAALADGGETDQAATLGAAARTLRAQTGYAPVLTTRGAELERALTTARANLDPGTFTELEREGAALDLESAVALALG